MSGLWTALLAFGVAGAAGFGAQALLSEALVLGEAGLRRWRLRGLRSLPACYLVPRREVSREDSPQIPIIPMLVLAVGIAVAIIARDFVLSPYLALLGLGAAWYSGRRAGQVEGQRLTEDIEALVPAFRSLFTVHVAIFPALGEAIRELPDRTLRRRIELAIARHAAGRSGLDDALSPLAALDNPHLSQFVFILTRLEQSDRDTADAVLRELEERLRARRRLRDRARTALTLLRGTVRMLQGANLAAVAVVLLMPAWREFFAGPEGHRLGFIVITALSAAASAYFDMETRGLEEQVL